MARRGCAGWSRWPDCRKLGSAGLIGSGLTQKAAGFTISTSFDLGGNVVGDMIGGASLGAALKTSPVPKP
ncbi:hypothetical protein ACFSC4_19395 [Deinococcus malanensis]|uniref:hypothetical protein n=1 Tax=Deinococcus malanensis TaxID=1706855 RepID=UPI003628DFA8